MKSILVALVLSLVGIQSSAAAQSISVAGSLDAGGSSDRGAAVFAKCKSCHQIGPDAKNSVGPVLNGVVGRKAGTYSGYNYSPATRNSGLVWDSQTLTRYLHAPREVVPGTRMAFAGLNKDHEVADLIAYLKQFNTDGTQVAK